VLSLSPVGARVLVEEGVVDAVIAHPRARKTRWEFEVGPYHVTVNGTKFRMAFRASDRAFRVSTVEGRVTVSGGCLEAPRTVSAGESLEPSCSSPGRQAAAPDGAPAHDLPPPRSAQDFIPAVRAIAPLARAPRSEPWRELLAAGHLHEGLRAAERADFARVCRIATAQELLALADAGRFSGRSDRASVALRSLRRRFPGSLDAGTAAFTMGRILFERGGAFSEAADWFETYLREQPNGALMGDAFGRLMEARLRSGDSGGARDSAGQYLRRFPQGPYAAEARGILSR